MRLWKFPDQVVRLGILAIAAIVATLLVRQRFVPATFGELGHYRAAAIPAIESQPIRYAGSLVCLDCHPDQGEIKNASYHRTLACEVCHGPAADHTEDYESHLPLVESDSRNACLPCHEYLSSRPTGFPQIIERLHNPLEPCVRCHDPHDPTPPGTPGSCSACHAQIARTKTVSHHLSLTCDTCHQTAPEHLQQPRAFLPKKPTERSFCGQCHARGTAEAPDVPKIDLASHGGVYLCWQCHYPHFPES